MLAVLAVRSGGTEVDRRRLILGYFLWFVAIAVAGLVWGSYVRDNDEHLTEVAACANAVCQGCTGDEWRAAWDGCWRVER